MVSTYFRNKQVNLIDPTDFGSNKYSSNSLKGCVLKVDLEYPKELQELNDDYYALAPDKQEIKEKMLYSYQLTTADLYKIYIGNVKK